MFRFIALAALFALPSCAIIYPAFKVVEKAAVTSIDVAGKAAGAGIDIVKSGYKTSRENSIPTPDF